MLETDIISNSQNTTTQSPVQNGAEAPLEATAVVEADVAAETAPVSAPPLEAPVVEAPVATQAATANENGAPLEDKADAAREAANSAPLEHEATLEIDQRRAKQLLDRAILLSERGDLAGAILASRQAVALTPDEPSGHSMLGLLQERSGDLEKAIQSYEKVLQLAPNSSLERDSLDRLKSTLESENSSVLFHFDDNELFEEPEAIKPATTPATPPAPDTAAKPSKTAAAIAAAAIASANASAMPALNVAPAASATPVAKADAPLTGGAAALNKLPAGPAKPAGGRPGFIPNTLSATSRQPSMALLMRKPSFYFKGAPIVAATTVGLLFMAWAEGVSQRQYLAETLPGSVESTVVNAPSGSAQGGAQSGFVEQSPVSPPQNGNANGGGIFGQGNNTGTAPTTSVSAPNAPAPRTGSAGGGSTGGSSSGGTAAVSSGSNNVRSLPPAIPQPGNFSGGGQRSGNGGLSGGARTLDTLPVMRPHIPASETVRPSASTGGQGSAATGVAANAGNDNGGNTGGTSNQGGPFNPAASPRGYIRVDPVRPINPVTPVTRPGNEAREAENAASRAAAAGRTTDVVPSLNRSIERQATGYTYQRRAMAFMEQGDFGRAADDFQSAIAGYEDQIRRGQNADDARNGISTSKSGLNLALSRMR